MGVRARTTRNTWLWMILPLLPAVYLLYLLIRTITQTEHRHKSTSAFRESVPVGWRPREGYIQTWEARHRTPHPARAFSPKPPPLGASRPIWRGQRLLLTWRGSNIWVMWDGQVWVRSPAETWRELRSHPSSTTSPFSEPRRSMRLGVPARYTAEQRRRLANRMRTA